MSNSTKEQKLKLLRQRFAKDLQAKITRIQNLWSDVQISRTEKRWVDLNHCVHSLSGSAPTFGFNRLGALLKEIEKVLRTNTDIVFDQEQVTLINDLINKAMDLANSGMDSPVCELSKLVVQQKKNEKPTVVYLEDDVQLAEQCKHHLEHFGFLVKIYHSGDSLIEACSSLKPDAMLVDIHLFPGALSGPDAISALKKSTKIECPVIFASNYDTWHDRLSVIRAGGHAYIRKPINLHELVEELDRLTGRSKEEYRILIVDDNELLAQHYATVLSSAGMETRVITDVSKVLDEMPDFAPDVVIMDIYMPGCTGVEAAGVIRQHSAYTSIPIIYLSTESELLNQLEALRVGGDDFLQKPITDYHLLSAVQIRAQRYRELRQLMNKDSLTGLLNHVSLKLCLEREVAAAERRPVSFCFAMIDIDFFKSINDNYGHPEGDRVIKTLSRLLINRLRESDIAGRYGGEEFAVVLKNTSLEDCVKVVECIRNGFSEIQFTVGDSHYSSTFSAGIVQWTPKMTMEELVSSADEALYKAKNQGRNRVCTWNIGLSRSS